jgi:hypothetical protein
MKKRRILGLIAVAAWGISCLAPSASLAREDNSPVGGVMPLILPEQANPEFRRMQDRIYRFAENQARHLLAAVHPWAADPALKLLTESKSEEHFIRLNTCALQGFAFLYRFGPYDEKRMGVSRKEIFEQTILPMMRYLTTTHATGIRPTGDGKKWGEIKKATHEQSPYWASMIGRAAWWLWADLPEDLRGDVRRVVAHEADWVAANPPQFRLRYDTKSEENAWHCLILDAAMLLLPDDPRREKWEAALRNYAISAFLRPADRHSSHIVDGRPVSEQYGGANVLDDFTLENHGFVHPDYMGSFGFTIACALDYAMSGRTPPESLFFNARQIYENLKWFYLPDGGCVYPNGEDWSLFQIPHFPDTHIQMAVYAADTDAWSLLKDCLETTAKMQARDLEGPIYVPEEIEYPGSQHILFEELGREWLMLQGAKRIVDRPKPPLGVKRLDFGKIILHRTPKAVHSVSWGAVVMAQCVPWRLDRFVSPDKENGVGHIRLVNGKRDLPINVQSANVVEKDDGFVADLVIHHGDAVRAELRFRSNADGSFVVREKLTALGDIATSEIATGAIGVLNNPKWVYETHRRKIQFDYRVAEVPALSGKVMEGEGIRQIDVDGGLIIESAAPLTALYRGARKIDRGRATDMLYLNYLGGERTWKRGAVISTYEVAISPQTAKVP